MLLSSTVQTEKDQVKRVKIRASGNLCVFRHQSLPLLYCVNFIRLIIGFCSSWFLHLLVFKWHLLCSMLGGGSKDRINLEYLGWSLMPENHSETSKYTNCRFWILVLPPKRSPKCPYDIYSLHLSEFWFFFVRLRPTLSMTWFWVFCWMQETILTRGQDDENMFPGRKLSCFSLVRLYPCSH